MKQIACVVFVAACSTALADHPREEAPPPKPTLDARFVPAIRKAAAAYDKWGRVDERPNIAPDLCRAPLPADYGSPSQVRLSAADDSPHGKKLYYLWASERATYLDAQQDIPVGFAIVKQSFAARPSAPPAKLVTEPSMFGPLGDPPPITWMQTEKGEWLTTGAKKDLYIMTKVGNQAGADEGWIYGTVAPDGTVTSAGRVQTCMSCHDEAATREKLFGLAKAPKS
jgi:hypothetical protein